MGGLGDELAYVSAAELAARIRRRELSPVEVLDGCIERIEARNASLGAFVLLRPDDARRAAQAAEAATAAGKPIGPLHGVPSALKDLYDFKPGWVSTFGGIPALAGFVARHRCGYAERVEEAGAVLVGKTNSPVLGLRGVTDNPLFGPARNPFDATRNAGGSSGGSAAAVADGLLPVAEGSDAGGSIRIPAAWCGVFGFQPSPGRVPSLSRPNGFGGTSPFRTEGPITRTVGDAALAMSALAGYHKADPLSLRDRVDWASATERGVAGLRIAYSPDLDVFPVDRRVAAVVKSAVSSLEEAGAHVEQVSLGLRRDQRELSDLWFRLMMPGIHATLARLCEAGFYLLAEHRAELPGELLDWLDGTAVPGLAELDDAQEVRTEVFDSLQAVFERHDLLVCPTVAALPVANAQDGNTTGPGEVEGIPVDPLIGWCLTYLTNFTGHPAASVPAGLADGMPVGLQVIGSRWGDADVLAASGALERVRPWSGSYARCAERAISGAGSTASAGSLPRDGA